MAQRRARIWTVEDDKYRPLLKRVKKLFPTLLRHVRLKKIALVGLQARSSPYLAKIFGNQRPYSLFIPQYDYCIVFFSSQFDDRPKSFRLSVVLHELYHIDELGHTEGSPGYRNCRKHDIEDWKLLRNFYGLHMENAKRVYKGETELFKHSSKKKHREGPRIG